MTLHQQIHPNEIGFDLDGVIADTATAFLRIACEQHNYCSFTLEDITSFELEGCIDMPVDLVDSIFNDIMTDSLATGLQPMHGAMEVLSELAEHNPITIITARHLRQPVVDWLERYYPHNVDNHFNLIATSDHDDKLRYIQDRKLKYFIDDRAETCKVLAESNITPLVYSHPWNRNGHSLEIVHNWQEIRDLINLGNNR
jgi:uncharacterized protein